MEFILKGTVHKVYDTQTITENFSKREFVLAIDNDKTKKTDYVKLEMSGARAEQLDKFNVGDIAEAHFNVRGTEYKSKSGEMAYFTSLNCWMIRMVSEAKTYTPKPATPAETKEPAVVYNNPPSKAEVDAEFEAKMKALREEHERKKASPPIVDDIPF
jgi:hypothetical protein